MGKPRRQFPVTGKPGGAGSKFLRVDFDSFSGVNFDAAIETKGPRLGWARATLCPCRGFNGQTDQLDPNCPKCNGHGYFFFRPPKYSVQTDTLGTFDKEQTHVLDKAQAVVIRGVMMSLDQDPDMFRTLGHWVFGSARLTVRGENRIGYYDRIISIDELVTYSELLDIKAGVPSLKTRYSVTDHNYVGSETANLTDDITTVDGVLTWKAGKVPSEDTRITVHYQYHPVWTVVNHLHVARSSLAKFRKPTDELESPEGDVLILPVQVMVRLEYLPMDPNG